MDDSAKEAAGIACFTEQTHEIRFMCMHGLCAGGMFAVPHVIA